MKSAPAHAAGESSAIDIAPVRTWVAESAAGTSSASPVWSANATPWPGGSQPVWSEVMSPLPVTAVITTGYGFGFEIVRLRSPTPPG